MRPARRALVLALLACWTAPGAVASAAAVHVGLHHSHHAEEAPHEGTLASRLAAAAEHGHSHDTATPDHEHLAANAAGVVATVAPLAAPPATMRIPEPRSHQPLPALPPPERPPPRPLFTLHCSLLR